MYPNLYYFFSDVFGIRLQGLKFINSFGFFVAIAFIAGAVALTADMKRKERLGLLSYQEADILVGKGPNWGEVLLNSFFGFLIGFKFIGSFFETGSVYNDPQGYIFSSRGSILAGLLLAGIFGGLKFWAGQKEKLPKPEKRTIRIWPHDRVGDIIIMAAIFGFAGAKVFHNLENWDEFIKAPAAALFSAGGFTFYGGLICATAAIVIFAKKHKIGLWHLADTFGPAMMIAYAVGRIGCQVSGDGDWGVPNSAYMADNNAKIIRADSSGFEKAITNNLGYYKDEFRTLGAINSVADVPHLSVTAPSWLPNWTVAYSFPHNVNEVGVKLANCKEDKYCTYLPAPVFPTSFYETIACTLLFLVLWGLRKRVKGAGVIAGLYLVFNGLERFLIEKIRVNTHYHIFGLEPTQAEIISFFLVFIGIAIIVMRSRVRTKVVA
ncbi:MAG: prolipoprotein diacylglyceryl transferase family protein [Chitinophagaceae bacterium]